MPSNKRKQFSLNLRTAPQTSCKLKQACWLGGFSQGLDQLATRITLVILRLIRERNPRLTGFSLSPLGKGGIFAGMSGSVRAINTRQKTRKGRTLGPRQKKDRVEAVLPYLRVRVFLQKLGPSGSCDVLLTYQLDGSVTDMLWLQRVQRIRVRSWRVGLRDCSYF